MKLLPACQGWSIIRLILHPSSLPPKRMKDEVVARVSRLVNHPAHPSSFILHPSSLPRRATPAMNILIQFLVPLAIMAMWALTSLLNREAQPLPTRGPAPNPGPGRANGPGGGRGEPVNASRFQPPASSMGDRTQSQRWPEVTPQARPGALRVGATDDGIMIIGSDNRGNRAQSSTGPPSVSAASAEHTRCPASARLAGPPGFDHGPTKTEGGRPPASTHVSGQSVTRSEKESASRNHALVFAALTDQRAIDASIDGDRDRTSGLVPVAHRPDQYRAASDVRDVQQTP